ncbi:CHROMATIN REMODELING 8-like protein [Drosera capensis]
MEEEEDAVLFNILGVTTANPEDIERDVIEKVTCDAEKSGEADDIAGVKAINYSRNNETSSSSHSELYNMLRALEGEIDAVERVKNATKNADQDRVNEEHQEEDADDIKGISGACPNDFSLQHALAADRLRSLKKKRAQLRKELSGSHKTSSLPDIQDDKLLQNLVREERIPKRKLKEVQEPRKELKKKRKAYSFDEDGEFDAEDNEIDGRASARVARSLSEAPQARPTTKLLDLDDLPQQKLPTHPFQRLKTPLKLPQNMTNEAEESHDAKRRKKRPLPGKKWRKCSSLEENELEGTEVSHDLATSSSEENQGVEGVNSEDTSFVTLEGGLRIPESIFEQLFDYQKIGVQWLWELHCQRAGGVIGDEMGLGKTVQVIAFLGSLHFSKMYKPSIIICPVTLLRQWKREARKWYPSFHVELLHDSALDASKKMPKEDSDASDYESENSWDSDHEHSVSLRGRKRWDSMIKRVLSSDSGLLITTYEQLRLLGDKLLDVGWGYAVLDEGHRIRNPNADITIVCKQLQTVHRIIMTGSPIQNKLTELWSLFDFVFPGKLGVLPVFEAEFAAPITVGGYANASPLQVSTAYSCT